MTQIIKNVAIKTAAEDYNNLYNMTYSSTLFIYRKYILLRRADGLFILLYTECGFYVGTSRRNYYSFLYTIQLYWKYIGIYYYCSS